MLMRFWPGSKSGESHVPESLNQRASPIEPMVVPHQMSFKQFVLFKSLDRRSYDQGEIFSLVKTAISFALHARRLLRFSVVRK